MRLGDVGWTFPIRSWIWRRIRVNAPLRLTEKTKAVQGHTRSITKYVKTGHGDKFCFLYILRLTVGYVQ